jgi:hypothetical protein
MMEWWTNHDTYAVSVWLWMLFILYGAAKVLSWTVFSRNKPKTHFYERPKRRAPVLRAFFGEKAKRAAPDQKDWDKV